MSKELETKAGLKAAVTATGSVLLQMKDSDRDLNKEKDPDPGSVSFRLKQIELLWSGLTADVPVVLKTLHKVRRIKGCCWCSAVYTTKRPFIPNPGVKIEEGKFQLDCTRVQ